MPVGFYKGEGGNAAADAGADDPGISASKARSATARAAFQEKSPVGQKARRLSIVQKPKLNSKFLRRFLVTEGRQVGLMGGAESCC